MGLFLLAWLMFAAIGCYVASQKDRPAVEGFVFGLLLGPIGLLIEACLPVLSKDAKADLNKRIRDTGNKAGSTLFGALSVPGPRPEPWAKDVERMKRGE